jgi:RND family efflux transporter MFP subunit
VVFNVDGYQGRNFSGKVARINPTTEAGSRAMLVYISVANTDGALKGGMFAKGSVTVDKSGITALVPVAALRQENGASVVYVIENNKIVARSVKLGLRNDDDGLAQVTTGLAKGARILIARLDGVKPGSGIRMAEPAPASSTTKKTS